MSQTKAQLVDAVDGSILTADLADDAVTAAKLASNAVVTASVADSAITIAKLSTSGTASSSTFLRGDGAFAAAGGGKLVGYGSAIKTDQFSASVGQGAFSSNCIQLSYTAASTSNKLLIMANLTIGYQHGQSIRMRFDIGGSTVDSATGDAGNSRTRATTEAWINSQGQMSNMSFNFLHSSPATSSTTYGCQIGAKDNATQTVYLNRSYGDTNADYQSRCASSLVILEFEP